MDKHVKYLKEILIWYRQQPFELLNFTSVDEIIERYFKEMDKMEEKKGFKITIDDGFCVYEYPLDVEDHSIDMVMTKIYKAFKIKKEKGKFIK
jgi:hypothetical protein